MGKNGDSIDAQSKKIHPFFTAPKSTSGDGLSNAALPVTPDPSCSPNSVENDANPSPPSDGRKRKRHIPDDAQDAPPLVSDSKPPKVLKLNRVTGTIGSPPRTHHIANGNNRRRGRKRKAFLASVRYGQNDDASRLQIAQRINDVLAGVWTMAPQKTHPSTPPSRWQANGDKLVNDLGTQKKETQGKDEVKGHTLGKKAPKPSAPNTGVTSKKPTHPFFQGKPKPSPVAEEKPKSSATSLPKRRVFFSSTPTSAKHTRPGPSKFNLPTLGMTSNNTLKVPGAQHPAWPSKETAHVRGDTPGSFSLEGNARSESILRKRKAKGQQVQVSESESILNQIASGLDLNQLSKESKAAGDDYFHAPPAILQIPSRHFESGKNLQARVITELKTFQQGGNQLKTHPAIAHAYDSIEKTLSAFDRSMCETSSWAQKYAPSSAERVLQGGREAELLRDWLEKLKVLAVDTGAVADSGAKAKAIASTKNKGKRKKKSDDFIVFSDEEADELSEISDSEGDWSISCKHSNGKKTVMRSCSRRESRDKGRLANAVVLSGPHGCGKTATVYAIAKELDFEVFEINAGARRNGKDILERVGDMTRNHLVQHRHRDNATREEATAEDEVDRDLKSGKQGMMTAFFKPNAKAIHKPDRSPTEPSVAREAKKPSKSQKQSLILLEEVDVLYEEDKQFWATVISMIAQSKRPFIMTCNDEALVPLQSLSLHGIFRLSSPPKDLAVDLLLLIAANEGHALRRHAIETLYDSRGHDLRASITELNYWCQIGVGDVQGGYNWFYPRWPKGSDVDEGGNTIRVVSQDTYRAGMGWFSRDSAVGGCFSRSIQEELHQQACQNWSLDTYESLINDDLSLWATAASERCSAKDRVNILTALESFAGFVSDADIGSQVSMDASTPNLPAKAREDYTVGRQLLDAAGLVRYDMMRLDISTALKDLGRCRLRGSQTRGGVGGVFKALGETEVAAKLEEHFDKLSRAEPAVTRSDYSLAFDPIAASEKIMASGYLDPSVFDGTIKTISLDVAPYVRGIVAYDQRLQQERVSRSNLLSEGGQPGKKRMRTTRSAYSALEGGSRASTRRERYFSADINPYLVMRTGGKGWDAIAASAIRADKQYVISSGVQGPLRELEEGSGKPD